MISPHEVEKLFVTTLPNDPVADVKLELAKFINHSYAEAISENDRSRIAEIALLAEAMGTKLYLEGRDWHTSHKDVWRAFALGVQPPSEAIETLQSKRERLEVS
ncbi:MAG: hypothetical protein EBZ48_02810 [Proteobacteria bacterium]|nr:hypothetical protein [Pseudomonadota bacterium]